jgi:hypothetical protein
VEQETVDQESGKTPDVEWLHCGLLFTCSTAQSDFPTAESDNADRDLSRRPFRKAANRGGMNPALLNPNSQQQKKPRPTMIAARGIGFSSTAT